MNTNNKYKYFYILKSGFENQKESLSVVENNLNYREGLKRFKQLRLELESTAREFIHIILMGVISEGNEVIIKTKEIEPNKELIKIKVNPKEEIETLAKDSESENVLNCTGRELLTYSIEDIDFMAKDKLSAIQTNIDEANIDEDYIEEKDKIEFSDYVNELTKSIKEIETDTLCDKTNSNLTKASQVQDFTENNSEYNVKKTLESINLKEYYKHISEIDSADIIRLLVDTFRLLNEKHNYNSDMINLLTKKRDCYCHDFENLDKMCFESIEEQNEFILSLGANMHKTGTERRKFKNEYNITEKVFKNLPKVRPAYYKPLTEIEKDAPEFDIDKAVSIKTYIYNYNTEAERSSLLKELNKKFDKVVDVEWGKFECYNKVGSINCKKLLEEVTSEITDKVDIIDEVSAKSYESIVNQVVSCGNTFLKVKGSSIKITNVNKKAANHLTRTIYHKYSKCAYDLNSKSLYLIERL